MKTWLRGARRLALPVMLATLAVASPALAQFGKNKVQYRNFHWYTIETDHFDIYYYEGEEESALHAARMAERGYARLSKILNHDIEDRVPVIVYASHTDFQQTNITPGLIGEGTGGITEYAKRRVFLPFTGSYGEFDHVLTHELVHAFQVDLMFNSGGEVNPFSFQPPLWFMEGMAEYLSIGGIDANTEMWLRWSALEGQLIPLHYMDRVFDIRVYRIGQAIFDFVGQRYGDDKIGELLRKTVYYRSVDVAFEKTLGLDLRALNDEWEQYVRRKYYPQIVHLNRPEEQGRRLIKNRDFSSMNVAPAISPDGERVVYIRQGRFSTDIVMSSAIDGSFLGRLVEGERSSDFESLRYLYTAIGWSPDGTRIAFPSKRGGEDVLNILDVDSRTVLDRLSFGFGAIYSPAFDPEGNRIAFVGVEAGKSDLFLVDLRTRELVRITDDPYLVRDPQWSPDGDRIAFVTDRGDDTDLENLVFGKPKIGILELESGNIELLAGQAGKNIAPFWGPDGNYLAFVSDRDGISNLYVQSLETDRLYRLTNLITGVTGITESSPPFSWARSGDRIVFTTFMGEGWELYQIEDPLSKLEEVEVVEPLERIARRERETVVPWAAPETLVRSNHPVAETEQLDALFGPVDASMASFDPESSEPESLDSSEDDLTDLLEPSGGLVTVAGPGTRNEPARPARRRFDPVEEPGSGQQVTLASVIEETRYRLPDTDSLSIRPYKLKWAPDFVGAAPFFASNVGFAGTAQVAISDILSNHVIQIGASIYGSIESSDLFLGYYNLAHRTNWGLAAYQYRNDFGLYTASNEVGFETNIYRGVQGLISHPFSMFNRVEFVLRGVAIDERVFRQSFESNYVLTEETRSGNRYYAGGELAFVKDNVVWGYYGPVHGTRARISSEQAFGDIQFNTTILDYRHYFALGRTSSFAVRLIGGTSNGNTPQLFRIGGPTTLRGVDYGEFIGHNVALINTELRFPLVETLRLGWPLRVGLGGVGGVLFFDVGSAFYDDERMVRHGALDDATAGYGLGFRLGLGYFALKYDISQRTDLKRRIGGSMNYFSIGVDF
ncbi:MAG: PD40 domain-containing protein [Gemmatimonadetes bacterium]|nr:PD40 domain-containing protein [Gemmatimonadota bacterium]